MVKMIVSKVNKVARKVSGIVKGGVVRKVGGVARKVSGTAKKVGGVVREVSGRVEVDLEEDLDLVANCIK
jgi:hypothetical protein